jgi:hypothetical protein
VLGGDPPGLTGTAARQRTPRAGLFLVFGGRREERPPRRELVVHLHRYIFIRRVPSAERWNVGRVRDELGEETAGVGTLPERPGDRRSARDLGLAALPRGQSASLASPPFLRLRVVPLPHVVAGRRLRRSPPRFREILSGGSRTDESKMNRPIGYLVASLCAIAPSLAEDWPEWRGRGRAGVWNESGIVDAFPAQGRPWPGARRYAPGSRDPPWPRDECS